MAKASDYEVKKTLVLYRGQQYKVQAKKILKVRGVEIIMLKLPHKKYDMWINADYVIRC